MIDPDDYAKEDCSCGHRRSRHPMSNGGCTGEGLRNDTSSLPEPVYEGSEELPFGGRWPANWPEPHDMPKTAAPCRCSGFRQPEPPEPDWA